MAAWEEFEFDCTDYLNGKYGDHAHFIHLGGSNSRVSDIKVETAAGQKFYIDAKHCPAQCGQFVLLPDIKSGKFVYSSKNAHPLNRFAQAIMEHMDTEFDEYRESGTAGKKIEMENSPRIFADWIIQAYKEKGTRFFITNGYTIFPVEQLGEYLDVTAVYRCKRSGSASVGMRKRPAVLDHIRNMGLQNLRSRFEGTKLFVAADGSLHDLRFVLGDYEYMFSQRGREYEIRRLSNTYNANVIFSIELKGTKPGLSDEGFIAGLG